MIVRVVFFILKLVREFLSDGELNTAWNREKIAMSQGFARYWVTLFQLRDKKKNIRIQQCAYCHFKISSPKSEASEIILLTSETILVPVRLDQ